MHAETDATMANASIEPQTDVACYPVETTEAVEFTPARPEVTAYVSPTPTGPSPLIYILPAGFGLIFGTMLGPWVERLSKRRRQNDEKGDE